MEDTSIAIEQLFEKAKNYSQTSFEILKYETIDKSTEILSDLVVKIVISLIAATALILSNIALALYLGKILGENFLGFFAVSGFYLVLFIIVYIIKDSFIKVKVRESLINEILN